MILDEFQLGQGAECWFHQPNLAITGSIHAFNLSNRDHDNL
jgi:hypothetical protein